MATRVQQGQRSSRKGIRAPLKRLVQELRRHYILYLMVLPGTVYFLVFQYYPMYGAIIAFKNY